MSNSNNNNNNYNEKRKDIKITITIKTEKGTEIIQWKRIGLRNKKQINIIDVVKTVFDVSGTMKAKNSKSSFVVEINKQRVRFQMNFGTSISIINLKTYVLLQKSDFVKSNTVLMDLIKN